MKVFLSFTLFLALALVLGGLLAYPIHLMTDLPMEKLVTKVSKLIAILSIVPFLALFHLNNKRAAGLHLAKPAFLREYLIGLGFGILTLAVLSGMLLGLDIRVLDPEYEFTVFNLLKAVLLGLLIGTLVACIEEIFFRGVMLTGIRRSTSAIAAVGLTALLYAGVHFIKSKGVELQTEPGLFSGLDILGQIAGRILRYANLDSFLALCSVGLFLALMRLKQGNIAQCIGLHAGWVMIIKTTKDLTNSNPTSELSFLVGTYDGIIGWLAFVYLCFLCTLYALWMLKSRPAEAHLTDHTTR